ncbi:hypothetical protein [Prauserella rugosa]|uniref:Uncharacterized protein n=1 Tax=Prauserella rugosa TaxID=43354 RepID=A0A660CE01_9PSEU|nr:hypothetical protein [Prauserella rugosa]KMS84289.1 hypothetical protein ACZ91_48630 [Streptomyces regensis]TWH19115.1 hypothetical protein JD82_00938 [Prauserella rugosa]
MPSDAFVTVLVLGALMIAVDGQILYRSGKRYLANADTGAAETGGSEVGSQVRLVTVLFHLAMLGALALLAVLDLSFGGGAIRPIVGNLGVLLLLLAVAHAVTMTAFGTFAEPQTVVEAAPRRGASPQHTASRQSGPVVAPVPGQRGRDPQMSPSIEEHSA